MCVFVLNFEVRIAPQELDDQGEINAIAGVLKLYQMRG
jgi:hypothetical protein